jgi:hypothetical protein
MYITFSNLLIYITMNHYFFSYFNEVLKEKLILILHEIGNIKVF